MLKKMFKNREGTALLVALLVMGVLISISLALSSLILRELRTTKGVLDAGKAYYAAESGIEVALYELNNRLPGWQTRDSEYVPLKLGEDFKSVGEYRVNNTCNAYPCFDEGFDVQSVLDFGSYSSFYDVLDLNESITIPLFVYEDGKVIPAKNFVVQFYAPFDPKEDFKPDLLKAFEGGVHGWDILRWKVFGIRKEGTQRTESISDFTAMSIAYNTITGEESEEDVAKQPSWFGSIDCSALSDGQKESRYAKDIICSPYTTTFSGILDDPNAEADIYAGVCDNTQAREYYDYGEDDKVRADEIRPCYNISEFLDKHDFNYLTLTNLMNKSVFDDAVLAAKGKNKNDLSKLYYRIEVFGEDEDGELVGNQVQREFADITANGYSGDSKQSINVKIQKGSFMPVFHFSLYSTYEAEDE